MRFKNIYFTEAYDFLHETSLFEYKERNVTNNIFGLVFSKNYYVRNLSNSSKQYQTDGVFVWSLGILLCRGGFRSLILYI